MTSPAQLLSDRHAAELRLQRLVVPVLYGYGDEVVNDAATAFVDAPVVVASITEPFSLHRVARRWSSAVRNIFTRIFSTGPAWEVPEDYMQQVMVRLSHDPTPEKTYEIVKSVLNTFDTSSRSKLTAELDARLNEHLGTQAARIARTEATGAFNAAREWEYQQTGGISHKRWVARMDDATRPSHRHANGQVVPLGRSFDVGGSLVRRPGDPYAPIGETAGCRCVIAPVRRPIP